MTEKAISDSKTTANISAVTGQNITLQCQAPDNIVMTFIEWEKSVAKKNVSFVRDGHVHSQGQDPSYQNRVFVVMKASSCNMILEDVMINDTGTYECFRFKNKTWELINTIHLHVAPPSPSEGPTGWMEDGSVGLIVGLIAVLVGLVGFCIYKRRQQRGQRNHGPA